MKFILITILFFGVLNISAQKVEVDQEFIDDAAKAFALVVTQRDEIAKQEQQIKDLRKLVETLESSARTPCTLAMNQVKNDLVFWFSQLGDNEAKNKKVNKVIDKTLKRGEKAINQQCGTSSNSVWKSLWEVLKVAAPVGAAIWMAND